MSIFGDIMSAILGRSAKAETPAAPAGTTAAKPAAPRAVRDKRAGRPRRPRRKPHYSGHMKDSAKMNVWLHKQVMIRIAANGSKVPEELKR
jgi:Domain of unknown function (DUF3597)